MCVCSFLVNAHNKVSDRDCMLTLLTKVFFYIMLMGLISTRNLVSIFLNTNGGDNGQSGD